MKTKTTSAKTPKLKPRRMWAHRYSVAQKTAAMITVRAKSYWAKEFAVPVVVIPLDDVEGLVDAAVVAYLESYDESRYSTNRESMTAALRAIGIPVPVSVRVKKEGRK